MSSEMRKPNGLFVLDNTPQGILSFLESISLRKIPGIGPTTEYILRGIGIQTCKDALKYPYKVKLAESDLGYEYVIKSALGIGRNVHEMPEDQKSISAQRTFSTIKDPLELKEKLNEVCKALAEDIEQNNKLGKTITVTIKTYKFELRSKTMQTEKYIGKLQEIQKEAQKVLDIMHIKDPIRLIGVKLSELIDAQEFQLRSVARFFEQKTKSKQKSEIDKQSKANESKLKENSIKELSSEQENDLQDNLSLEQFENKKITPRKEEKIEISHNLEEIKEESKKSASKAPPMFDCPICGQQIDCQGNNARMNNHIDQCLKSQDRQINSASIFQSKNNNKKLNKKQTKLKKKY